MPVSTFAYNPQLPFIKEGYPGNRLEDERFLNEGQEVDASFRKVLKWRFTKNDQKEEKAKENFTLPVVENRTFTQLKKDVIVWLGHATFFIHINGVSILLDPIFDNIFFIKRRSTLPCKVSDIQPLYYILLSHGHRDHLDKSSLRKVTLLNLAAELLIPLRMEKLIASLGIVNKCQEAGWYQQYRTKEDLQIIFLPALHWHRRGLTDYNRVFWGSFLIKSPQKLFILPGIVGMEMENILEIYEK